MDRGTQMKSRKNIVAAVLLMIVFAFAAVLTGCGSEKTDTASQAKTSDFNYLILVNKENKLPDDYEEIVDLIDVENSFGDKFTIEKKTYEAFQELRTDLMGNDGIQIELDSVYRSVQEQEELAAEFTKQYGEEYVKQYVAVPGYSEHHTGLAVDIGVMIGDRFVNDNDEMISQKKVFAKIHKKLAAHGFILRYLKGKEDITGYSYEPWHFRYIDDSEAAETIMDQGLTLEEYLSGQEQ